MPKHRTKAEKLEVLEKMKVALKKPDTLCKIVCLDLGFREDTGCRFFKEMTGMTMMEYLQGKGA